MALKGKPAIPPKRQRLAPEVRKAHILDAAQKLFFARGWDEVTISDVLDEAGISKGGFYPHFAAKEDLLDGVVERFTNETIVAAKSVRDTTTGDALAQFNLFLAESSRWKAEQGPQLRFFIDVLLRPGNDFLFHRIAYASAAITIPVLKDLIVDGITEGLFDVPDADLAAETIMALSQGRRAVAETAIRTAEAGDIEEATTLLDDRMVSEGWLIDRLLGLPQDSIVLSNPAEYRHMLRAMTDTL